MTVQITGNLAQAKALIERLRADKDKAVYVGFPAEFDKPVEGAENFNLASLAAVLELGNEHIKPRPFYAKRYQKTKRNTSHFSRNYLSKAYRLRGFTSN